MTDVLATLIRIQVPALVVLTAWLLVIESLVVGERLQRRRFGLGRRRAGTCRAEPRQAAARCRRCLLLVGYAVAAIAAGSWLTMRRDIASASARHLPAAAKSAVARRSARIWRAGSRNACRN